MPGSYISGFAPLIESFVGFQIVSERWNRTFENNMHSFDRYCAKNFSGAKILTQEMADAWCMQGFRQQIAEIIR